MCGIAGIIGNSNKETVQAMLTETAHRGPDDHGIYSDEECTLGHNRLSIIDLSNAGHQPMISADKRYVMVFNGEIFNYKIKRKILTDKGIHFNTKTDSEVLLQLFIMYKEKCLEHLEGMYAFAIWDTKEKTLFCARDKFGIKPLYYKNIEGTFLFCSEIKGLLKVDRSSRICEDSMFAFLMFGDNFSPSTFVKNIHSLKAGHYLIYKQGKISCSKFNKPADHNLPPPKTYEEAKADVKSLVISSVREQLVSDVPLGLFLSGGLDSNIIAYVATQLLGENKINSYTISHDGIGNEGVMAEETARFYNTIHNEYRIGNNDVALEFDSFITSIDQPTYNGINNYFVSKYSKKDITVALSGLGGDELFFGYNWQFNLMQEYNPNDKWAKLMGMLLPIIPSKLDKLYF